MNKELLIEEYLKKEIEVGDVVNYNITWNVIEKQKIKGKKELQDVSVKKSYNGSGEVLEILENDFIIKNKYFSQGFPYFIERDFKNDTIKVPKIFCSLNTDEVGYNPKFEKSFRISESKQELASLFTKIYGYKNSKDEIRELNWNPIFNTEDGIIHYQRDFCWSLKDKQLLIESIYNDIPIGRFIFRKRGWEYAVKYKNDPIIQGAYYDIVDSKQRLNALQEFYENKYPDLNGFYYKDFSLKAQRTFLRFDNLIVAELPESTTDKQVKEVFLKTNYSGIQMSQDHLDFVKSIKI